MSDDAIGAIALPPRGAKPSAAPDDLGAMPLPPRGKQIEESPGKILAGAVEDTFSTDKARPGAVGLMGAPGTDTPARVLVKPQGAEHLIRAAVTAPMFAGGALPSIAAGAGLGAVEAMAKKGAQTSMGDVAWGALVDGAITAATRGVLSGVSSGLARVARPKEATEAIKAAVNRGPDAGVNTELVQRIADRVKDAASPVARDAAVRNAVEQLNALRPGLGDTFAKHVAGSRVPPAASSMAAAARSALDNPAVKGAVTAESLDPYYGVPLGVLGATLFGGGHLPGVGKYVRAAEEVAR